jgi:hypothetical protein
MMMEVSIFLILLLRLVAVVVEEMVAVMLRLPPQPQQQLKAVLISATWISSDIILSSNNFARSSSNNPRCLNLFYNNSVRVTLSSHSSLLPTPISSFNFWGKAQTMTFPCPLARRPFL